MNSSRIIYSEGGGWQKYARVVLVTSGNVHIKPNLVVETWDGTKDAMGNEIWLPADLGHAVCVLKSALLREALHG
jgi:hypothetical protein